MHRSPSCSGWQHFVPSHKSVVTATSSLAPCHSTVSLGTPGTGDAKPCTVSVTHMERSALRRELCHFVSLQGRNTSYIKLLLDVFRRGRDLRGDNNAGHMLMRQLGTKYPGDRGSVCKGHQPPPPLPSHLALFVSKTSSTGCRGQAGWEGESEAAQHTRQSRGISRETPLCILQS